MKLILRKHQIKMLRYSFRVTHPALFCDMRGGKTVVTIRRCKMFNDCKLFLVVAPYSALKSWRESLKNEREEFLDIAGDKKNRLSVLSMAGSSLFSQRTWFLTNKECHLSIGDELASVPWDVVIIDESTFTKDPHTAVSWYFVKNFRNAKHRFILTGTPAPEHELNYFQQLMFLDKSILNLANYHVFRKYYFLKPLGKGSEHTYFLSRAGKKLLTERLAKYCCFVTRDEIGFKSEPVFLTRTYQLPATIRKTYQDAEKLFIMRYKDKILERTFWSIEVFCWLRQLCGGYYEDKESGTVITHKVKLDGLKELVTGEFVNLPIVVWSVFRKELDAIVDALSHAGVTVAQVSGSVSPAIRKKREQDFNEGKYRVLVCQPECYRHGADFSVASTVIYYSVPLSLETWMQSQRRTIVMNKRVQTLIINLVMENTVDEDILLSLKRKEGKSEQIKSIVQGIYARQNANR